MSVEKSGFFRRGLDPFFIEQLLIGAFRPLMNTVRDRQLDLEIRENYINVYCGRNSILKLEFRKKEQAFCASVHSKYNPPSGFIRSESSPYGRQVFKPDGASAWTALFIKSIPQICQDSAMHNKPEGDAEFRIIQANHEPPFLVLDRQLQLEGVRDSKVDILGLSIGDGCASMILVELKHGKKLQVLPVLEQIDRYRKLYAPDARMRRDVADALDETLSLKRKLGLLDGAPPQPLRDLLVEFLVVLVSADSPVLSPPETLAGGTLVHYIGLAAGDWRIPERKHWKTLRSS